jgi:DNA anti-recombination protein RmuC
MRNKIETEQYIKDVFEQKYEKRVEEEIVMLEEINQHHLKKIEELLNENKKLKKENEKLTSIIEGYGNQ